MAPSLQAHRALVSKQHRGPVHGTLGSNAFPLRHRVSVASPVVLEQPTALSKDVYEELSQLAKAETATAVSKTPLGRGLVATREISVREPIVSVPARHALIIADDPVNGISIYSDRHHRRWQELYGDMPELLLEFLQGEARWDVRMAAWLLYMKQHSSPLWQAYMALLPKERDMACLLNYSRDEMVELQVPALKAEAAVQADWCAYLHGHFLHCKSGTLAPLNLSSSLADSLWALSMVRSRTFSEDVAGEPLTLMVPYADLANHSFDNNATFCFSKDNKSFQLQSLAVLQPGSEVTISYGAAKPNAECLRDYGFIMPGNPCDRIHFGGGSSSSSSSMASVSSMDDIGHLPKLHPVSLLQAVGFRGDLAQGQCEPLQGPPTDYQQQLRLARRRTALLSMPLCIPQAAASGAGSSSSSSSGGGGLFGWLDAATQPWTPSGRPDPEPLKPQQVPAERVAVQQLQNMLLQQLARLPTSAATDEQLLLQAEQLAAAAAEATHPSSSSVLRGASVGITPDALPLISDANSATGLKRQHWTVTHKPQQQQQQQQQQQAARRSMQSNSVSAAAAARKVEAVDAAALVASPRLMTAVRARLEHKLLLREGVAVLMLYDKYLATQY